MGAAIAALVSTILPILERVIPDANARQRAAEEMARAVLDAQSRADQGQLEVNKAEAANPNIFVSGWRPFVGWVCAAGFAWLYVVCPVIDYLLSAFGIVVIIPDVDTTELTTLLMALLGLGGLRTYERVQGAARTR